MQYNHLENCACSPVHDPRACERIGISPESLFCQYSFCFSEGSPCHQGFLPDNIIFIMKFHW